jgi:two-component system, sensor histidine kinase and response regulator
MATDDGSASAEVPLGELPTDVLWSMSLDGTITYVSSEVYRVRGLTPEEAKAQVAGQITTPESTASAVAYLMAVAAAVEAGTELPTYHEEQTYYRADGSMYPCEVRATARIREDGEVEVLGISRGLETD